MLKGVPASLISHPPSSSRPGPPGSLYLSVPPPLPSFSAELHIILPDSAGDITH